jgi:glycosyltransferase involved in cell wall biosynthesis
MQTRPVLISPSPVPKDLKACHIPVSSPLNIPHPIFSLHINTLNYFFPTSQTKVCAVIKKEQPEIVEAFDPWSFIPVRKAIKNVGAFSTVHFLVLHYILACNMKKNRFLTKFLRNIEIMSTVDADLVIAMSQIDKIFLTEIYGVDEHKIEIFPNGVDLKKYSLCRKHIYKTLGIHGPIVLFVGRLDTYANYTAAELICQSIAPSVRRNRKEVKFVIIGGPVPKKLAKSPGVHFIGPVDNNLLPHFISSADVCIAPLTIGSGLRMKILEYFAAKKPVVSTSVGMQGISCQDEKEIIICDDLKEFPHRILQLLDDENARQSIGNQAYELVRRKYAWESLVISHVKHIKNLLHF